MSNLKEGMRVVAYDSDLSSNRRYAVGIIHERDDGLYIEHGISGVLMPYVDGMTITEVPEDYTVCERCGKVTAKNYGDDFHKLCEKCRENGEYTVCEGCGDIIDITFDQYKTDGSDYVCECCMCYWTICKDCGKLIKTNDSIYESGDSFCKTCYLAKAEQVHVGDTVYFKYGGHSREARYFTGEIQSIENDGVEVVVSDIVYGVDRVPARRIHVIPTGSMVCERCGKVITENYGDDNHILCEDCRNSGFYSTCKECGCLIDTIYESYLCYEDEYICDACSESGGWEVCADCGRLVQYEDCEADDSDTIICNDCFRARWTHCDDCGDLVRLSDAYSDDYTTVCDDCFYDRWTFCEDCGKLFNIESEGDRIDDSYYCDNCVDDHRNIIHEYGYKPYPEFYGLGSLYMGVELEIDEGGKDDEAASELADIVDDKMYFKEDGSLNDGFECVTHPMTLSYHLNCFPWDDLCKRAIQLGYTSHNAETCGLHVHVSRDALGKNQDEIDATIARILYFFESHWSQMVRFSRRTEEQLDEWAQRYAHKDSVHEYEDDAKSRSHGRYMCVNLQNSSTIEFRIFRGTLKASTIKATLELVDTLCRICSEHTAADIQQMEWDDFIRLIPEQHTELHEYLKTRGLHIKNTKDEEDEI